MVGRGWAWDGLARVGPSEGDGGGGGWIVGGGGLSGAEQACQGKARKSRGREGWARLVGAGRVVTGTGGPGLGSSGEEELTGPGLGCRGGWVRLGKGRYGSSVDHQYSLVKSSKSEVPV
jgi:hypothetical protein